MSKDINVNIRTETDKAKVDEYGNAFDAAGKKVNEAGGHAEGATGKINLLGKAVNSVQNYLLGYVSIKGLWEFFQKWLDYVNEISEAQKELVESTKALDQAAKSLAGQANVMGVPGGVEAAREQVLAIQKVGRLGSFELAEGVAVAAHSAFGTSGQLLTPEQLAIAGSVAEFAQERSVSPSSVGDLFKLLSKMGVTNAQEADRRIQQLSAASKGKGFDQFIASGVKSIIPALAAGESPEMAMAQYVSALDAMKSPELAATMTTQVSAMMLRPEVAKAIGGNFPNLPPDQQKMAFAQWVARSSNQQLMDAGVGEVLQMKALYSPKQLRSIGETLDVFKIATGEQRRADAAAWHETTQGRIEAIQAETERLGATATPEERIGQVLINAGETRWRRIKRAGQDWVLMPNTLEKSRRGVWGPLIRRHDALIKAIDEGKLPENQREDVENIGQYISSEYPTLFPPNPLTPAEVGRANTMLSPLERQAGITINYNYNSGPVFARPGVEPTPRVSRSDIEN